MNNDTVTQLNFLTITKIAYLKISWDFLKSPQISMTHIKLSNKTGNMNVIS